MSNRKEEQFVEYTDLIALKKYVISLLKFYRKQKLSPHRTGAIEAMASISMEIDRLMKQEGEEDFHE